MSRPSNAILRIVGAITTVLSITTTVFFALFAVSTTSLHSELSAPCIASATLDAPTCALTLLFTVSPRLAKTSLLLSGVIPTVLAGILSAATLGWINIRYDALPERMFNRLTDCMVVGAFSVFVVNIVFQTAFWTLLVLASPSQRRQQQQEEIPEPITPSMVSESMAELAFPSPVYTHFSSITPSRDSKHSSFVTQILHPVSSRTKLRNASSVYEVPMSAAIAQLHRKEPEIDHFDLWDTSNVGAPERAACSLAAEEFEEDHSMSLGIFTSGGVQLNFSLEAENELRAIGKGMNDDSDAHLNSEAHERRTSPPIPDCEIVSRRSSSLPIVPIRSPLVSPRTMSFPKNSLSISSRSSRQENRGLELTEVFGAKGDMGSGRWIVKPQAAAYNGGIVS
ncbi:hypothetical protein RUND412_008135 [Rhizina undulata]